MQKLLHPGAWLTSGRGASHGFLAAAAAALLCVSSAYAQLPAASAGGEPARELLNSERIEQRFGSYGIEVLESGAVRVSNLYSVEDGRRICRTFAVVRYPERVDDAFANEHEAILKGGSIGAVFAAAGWRVTKRHLYYGELDAGTRVRSLMGEPSAAELAAHIYVLRIDRDGAAYDYAVIAEVHHPDYLVASDLPRIYGAPSAAGSASVVQAMLELTREKLR